jgi:predicted PolB exonuclease-like 3'-5' exonuclease
MGKKPWDTPQLVDTMELWKFGDLKAYTSLESMAACLGIPTSKDDIDGSEVGKVYYSTGDVKRIATYCQKDVAVMAQVYARLMGLGNIPPGKILIQG